MRISYILQAIALQSSFIILLRAGMLFPPLAHITRFRHRSLFLLPQHDLLIQYYLLMVASLLVCLP
jgi:hypothetical protein